MNFPKPLHEMTEDEIKNGINHWPPQYGMLGVIDLQRRQQEKGNAQITTLVNEIKKLKEITDKTATTSDKSSQTANKLALRAIQVTFVLSLIQVAIGGYQLMVEVVDINNKAFRIFIAILFFITLIYFSYGMNHLTEQIKKDAQ